MKPVARRSIPKKISTLPRQKTEAANYLELYQLSIEKNRLYQELETIEQRRQQIQQRLVELQTEMNQLQKKTEPSSEPKMSANPGKDTSDSSNYQSFTLEY